MCKISSAIATRSLTPFGPTRTLSVVGCFFILVSVPYRVAGAIQANGPAQTCTTASPDPSGYEGIIDARSDNGSFYKFNLSGGSRPVIRPIYIKLTPKDDILIDAPPAPMEIPLVVSQVGGTEEQWTAFSAEQKTPPERSMICWPVIVFEKYRRIPPPKWEHEVYEKDQEFRLDFSTAQPTMTVTSDYWFHAREPDVIRFRLAREGIPFALQAPTALAPPPAVMQAQPPPPPLTQTQGYQENGMPCSPLEDCSGNGGFDSTMGFAGAAAGLLTALLGFQFAGGLDNASDDASFALSGSVNQILGSMQQLTGASEVSQLAKSAIDDPHEAAFWTGELLSVADEAAKRIDSVEDPLAIGRFGIASTAIDAVDQVSKNFSNSDPLAIQDATFNELGKLAYTAAFPEAAVAALGIDPVLHEFGQPGIMDTIGEGAEAFGRGNPLTTQVFPIEPLPSWFNGIGSDVGNSIWASSTTLSGSSSGVTLVPSDGGGSVDYSDGTGDSGDSED
jgi:hypothetical protein